MPVPARPAWKNSYPSDPGVEGHNVRILVKVSLAGRPEAGDDAVNIGFLPSPLGRRPGPYRYESAHSGGSRPQERIGG
ncbi:hypothetical protein GCM10010232_36780 [Streptomyces amakusaensis]|uniref:Uncharacterized protein n=1 Tax=Streptomyces inusitatus TaxID=68221 RepID=A0A918UUS9_9ACTN|nr:hypothetical protein GCM10010387_30840 [Streptomyces inusitatus]